MSGLAKYSAGRCRSKRDKFQRHPVVTKWAIS